MSGTEIAMCSDNGSGYHATQYVLACREMKKLTGVAVRWLHYNASGEGKRWETDGHNPLVKALRELAMRAGLPSDCISPAKEVQAAQFNGGVKGTRSKVISFDYEAERKPQSMAGIGKYHDIKLYDNGDIRVWRTYGVGEGRLIKKAELDRLYPVDDATGERPTQGPTGVTLTGADAGSVGGFVHQPSAKRRRKELRDKDARRRDRGAAREVRETAKSAQSVQIAELKRPLGCLESPACAKRFCRAGKRRGHACSAIVTPAGPPPPIMVAAEEVLWSGNEGCSAESLAPAPVKGHGVAQFLRTQWMTPSALEICEEEFQKGQHVTSNRQGALEIHSQCERNLPSLAVPTQQAVINWLSARLQVKEGDTPAARRVPKTAHQQRQALAATTPRVDAQRLWVNTPENRELFYKKYIDVVLVVPVEEEEEEREQEQEDLVGSDEESEPEYTVSRIIDRRRSRHGHTEFRVRWTGFSESHDTWETRMNLANALAKVQQFEDANQDSSDSSEEEEEVRSPL